MCSPCTKKLNEGQLELLAPFAEGYGCTRREKVEGGGGGRGSSDVLLPESCHSNEGRRGLEFYGLLLILPVIFLPVLRVLYCSNDYLFFFGRGVSLVG